MGNKGFRVEVSEKYFLKLTIGVLVLVFAALIFMFTNIWFLFDSDSKLAVNIVRHEASVDGIAGEYENDNYIFEQEIYDNNLGNRRYNKKIVSFAINNGAYESQYYCNNFSLLARGKFNETIKFIDLNLSDGIVLPSIEEKLIRTTGAGFLKYGQGFEGDGKRQIIISENFMTALELDPTCIGKVLTLRKSVPKTNYQDFPEVNANYISTIDNDTVVGNQINNTYWNGEDSYIAQEFSGGVVSIFERFKIVGVINKHYNLFNPYASDIWMSTSSVINSYTNNFPIMTYVDKFNSEGELVKARVVTYPNEDIVAHARSVTKNGYVFPFFMRGGFVSETNAMRWSTQNYSQIITTYEIEYQNFNDAKSAYNYALKKRAENHGNISVATIADNDFLFGVRFNDFLVMGMSIFFVLAVVILVEEFIRYNIITHNQK